MVMLRNQLVSNSHTEEDRLFASYSHGFQEMSEGGRQRTANLTKKVLYSN